MQTQQHTQLQTNPPAACTEEGLGRQQQPYPSVDVTTAVPSQVAFATPPTAVSQHAHTLRRTDAIVTAGSSMHGTKRSAADMGSDNTSPAVSHKRKQQGQSMSHSADLTPPGQEMLGSSHSRHPAGQQGQQLIYSTQLALQARQRQKPIHGTTFAVASKRQEQIPGTGPAALTQQTSESSHDAQPALLGFQHSSQQDLPLVPLPSLQQEEDDMDGSCLNDTVGAIFIDASGDGNVLSDFNLFASCTKRTLHPICLRFLFPL